MRRLCVLKCAIQIKSIIIISITWTNKYSVFFLHVGQQPQGRKNLLASVK